jgi:hypothetical protein
MRPRQEGRQFAGADDQQRFRIGRREIARGQRRGAGLCATASAVVPSISACGVPVLPSIRM